MFTDVWNLPSELVVTPQPLIGLCGLDIVKNSVHKSIWDAFSNNRKADRALIQFKLLPQNYEFPVSKPKRQSYEWYHPKGILKRNWMLKHLHVLPSVVVLFQDIEWNDPQWTEKQLQCASLVQSLKNSLHGRNTKLAIVLLQRGSPLPPGEDLLASERAASITNGCDINAKMLFVLPHNDHLMGYTLRLESAFLELAQSYYAQMAKQIRLHRDQLTSSHQNLRIRHQFKLGFVAEMKLDYSTALKHYSQAAASVDEIRIVDTNCLEIKTVAGFTNYKICKLMFKINVPRDSITQFKTHIEKYKSRSGFKELIFEHFAWLSVQYSGFAELFCEAIKNGLPALQTQHPGIYYHKAAEYMGKRKETFLQCCALSLSPTEPNQPTASALFSDFFGVRGTKTGEPISEQQIITLIQENEKSYNHSAGIISLLGQAMAQFKVYKCLRFRKKLAIDMAEEYLKCGDHSKALTLFSLMLSDYRVDKWFKVFTEVLLKTLRSAYLSASIADYILCSIEAMSSKILIDQTERIVILENLWKVFQKDPPVSQSQIAPELKSNWENALSVCISPITIDLDKLCELLHCKVSFDKPQVKYEEQVKLVLYIKSTTNVPLKLRNFAIILTDSKSCFKLQAQKYNEYIPKFPIKQIITESNIDLNKKTDNVSECDDTELININKDEFMLLPDKCYKIHFYGDSYQFMENVELQIVKLEIQMGSDKNYVILTQSATLNKINVFKNYNPRIDYMEYININPSCYIIPTFHLTAQINQKNQPMLVNEYYKVVTNISNSFNVSLQNVGITITIPNSLRNKVFLATDLSTSKQKLVTSLQIDVGDLQIQTTTAISYYIASLFEGNIELLQKLWYQTENLNVKIGESKQIFTYESPTNNQSNKQEKSISSNHMSNHNMKIEYLNDSVKKIKEDTIIIPCIEEIGFTGRLYTLSRQALTQAYKNEDFLLRLTLEVKSPCPIDILEIYFLSDYNIISKPYGTCLNLNKSIYSKGDKLEDIKILRSINTTNDWVKKAEHFDTNISEIKFLKNKIDKPNDFMINKQLMNKSDDTFNKNLLSKIPSNTTIIGNTNLISNQLNMSSSFDDKLKLNISDDATNINNNKNDDNQNIMKTINLTKQVYNSAIDSIEIINDNRGFFKTNFINETINVNQQQYPIFGVYCIKWRRSGQCQENESKFLINGIEIIESPLNIYCYIKEKMYVRIPMTLTILLKNSTRNIINLQAVLNNSDSFMFAGHKQLNISIYPFSSYELPFNLYPLKSGWQQLPELNLEYNTLNNDNNENQMIIQTNDLQNQLNNLVNRWMPKRVFIHPPTKFNEL